MGTILMKASITEIDENLLDQYNYDNLDGSELRAFTNVPAYREKLLTVNMPRYMQQFMHDYRNLSKEECLSIIEHSEQVWDHILTLHQLDLETLYKYADKIDLSYVEVQECIDVAFVEKYVDRMDTRSFVQIRADRGDLFDFMHIPEIMNRYSRTFLKWSTSREQLAEYIKRMKPTASVESINAFISKMYDVPVNEQTLTEVYSDRERAGHSIDAVLSYYRRNRTQLEYANWDEYVADCKRTGDDGLADVWFRDFHRGDIVAFCEAK